MKSYTFTDLKSNIDSVCDEIVKECEAVEFVRRRRQRFVIMSKNEYDNLIENDYTMRNNNYYGMLVAILAENPNQIEAENEARFITDEEEDAVLEKILSPVPPTAAEPKTEQVAGGINKYRK